MASEIQYTWDDVPRLTQLRANARRRFTRNLRFLEQLHGKDKPSRTELLSACNAAQGDRVNVNARVDDLRNCLEYLGDEAGLDKLDAWCALFDADCLVISTVRATLEEISVSNVSAIHSEVSEISGNSAHTKVQKWQANSSIAQKPSSVQSVAQLPHATQSPPPLPATPLPPSRLPSPSQSVLTHHQPHIRPATFVPTPIAHVSHQHLDRRTPEVGSKSSLPHTSTPAATQDLLQPDVQASATQDSSGAVPTRADMTLPEALGIVAHEPTQAQPPLSAMSAATMQHLVETATMAATKATLNSSYQQGTATSHLTSTNAAQFAKLPRLELQTFDGNVLAWPHYWAMFASAVDQQPSLSNIAKFTYLRNSLSSQALSVIAGLAVTEENYSLAIDMLQQKFGRPEVIITALYAKLYDMPAVKSQRFSEVQHAFQTINTVLQQLENQGEDLDGQRSLHQQLFAKFPLDVKCKLEEWRESDKPWTIGEFRTLMQKYIRVRERVMQLDQASIHTAKTTQPTAADVLVATTKTKPATSSELPPCIFCSGKHRHDDCPMPLADRKQFLSHSHRCYICFRVGHSYQRCTLQNRRQCFHCKQRNHNRAICPKHPMIVQDRPTQHTQTQGQNQYHNQDQNQTQEQKQKQEQTQQQKQKQKQNVAKSTVSTIAMDSPTVLTQHQTSPTESVFLQTATISLSAADGTMVNARLLLDTGSQKSYMTETLACRLNLPTLHTEDLAVSTFGCKTPSHFRTRVVEVTLPLRDGTSFTIQSHVFQGDITRQLERAPLQQADLDALCAAIDTADLADSLPDNSGQHTIDILVGADYAWDLFTTSSPNICLPSGLRVISSRLGYLLAGRSSTPGTASVATFFVNTTALTTSSLHLDHDQASIEHLWKLDAIGITEPPQISDDDQALGKFNASIQRLDGRYHVRLAWKSTSPQLPSNYGLALGRLRTLSRRFTQDRALLDQYNSVLQQQLQAGVIEPVTSTSPQDRPVHYLPHHPVIKSSSSTTKLRIVYDASAKAKRGDPSLNSCLFRGPVLLPDLAGLLLRFRVSPIILAADIEKAFLQIGINICDRDALRFLWFQDPVKSLNDSANLQVFRFCRVPFGLICSPFLLAATITHHLRQADTDIAHRILQNIYVDNVVLGCQSVTDAQQVFQEGRSLFQDMKMNLREWVTNSSEVSAILPVDLLGNTKACKMLGLQWQPGQDTLHLSPLAPAILHATITKRAVLQVFASVFDPLGLFAPVTFVAKLFFQRLWSLSYPWDQPLPPDLQSEWSQIQSQLSLISSVTLPRLVTLSDAIDTQLLAFTDASENGYAATIFLRVASASTVSVHLLFAKVRLSPKKMCTLKAEVSIPRLELLGVLIGVRALNFVRRALDMPVQSCTLWTDSACVLSWIASHKPLPRFVHNRIQEINQAKDVVFRYVKSASNPADIPTRGTTVSDLEVSSLWWHGPDWLLLDPAQWPSWATPIVHPESLDDVKEELSVASLAAVDTAEQRTKSTLLRIPGSCYSSLTRLVRITQHVLLFLKLKMWNHLKVSTRENATKKHPLFARVMNTVSTTASGLVSLLLWIQQAQYSMLREVHEAILHNTKNCLRMQLGIVCDQYKLLLCRGRMVESKCVDRLLLPRKHWLTRLIIMDVHAQLLHSGPLHTLTKLQRQFWIPQGKTEVRSALRKCMVCKRYEGPCFALPQMPPLPKERVSQSAPFEFVGIDYFGPLYIWTDGSSSKIWVCLYTCLATRAVHLEYVSSLDTPHFLNCLRRFAARRGTPAMIVSDNAPQFHLASSALNLAWQEAVRHTSLKSYLQNKGIQWKFIPELSPWQGGVYERLVGIIKKSLRKSIGRRHMNLEDMMTLLTSVEEIVNSRPITSVPTDEDGVSVLVLTPSHFLTPGRQFVIPVSTIPVIDSDSDSDFMPLEVSAERLVQMWKRQAKTLSEFWQHWQQSYLPLLLEKSTSSHRQHGFTTSDLPTVGTIVIIKDENQPRAQWKFGKITDVSPSRDGNIRSAKVLTPSGRVIVRPVSHLYPLEIQQQQQSRVSEETDQTDRSESTQQQITEQPARPRRSAFELARVRLSDQLAAD